MSLSQNLRKRKELNLEFTGMTYEITFEGDKYRYTFKLSEPMSKIGSTKYDDYSTGKRQQITEIQNAEFISIIDDDMDKFEDEFITEVKDGETVITGYKGSSLVIDVSKPRFNRINGKVTKPSELWLKTHLFSETPMMKLEDAGKKSM